MMRVWRLKVWIWFQPSTPWPTRVHGSEIYRDILVGYEASDVAGIMPTRQTAVASRCTFGSFFCVRTSAEHPEHASARGAALTATATPGTEAKCACHDCGIHCLPHFQKQSPASTRPAWRRVATTIRLLPRVIDDGFSTQYSTLARTFVDVRNWDDCRWVVFQGSSGRIGDRAPLGPEGARGHGASHHQPLRPRLILLMHSRERLQLLRYPT